MKTSRRSMVVGGTATAVTAWVTPSILTLDSVAAASGSSLGITASTAVTLLDPAPASVRRNVMQSDTSTFVFAEPGCTLTSDLVVNRQTPGTFNGNSNELAVIPAGTSVCSYIVHADRATNGTVSGSLTFAEPILGLIYEQPQFDASNYLGFPTTTYPIENGEFIENNDDFVLSTNTVQWSMSMGGIWSDTMRVITAC